MNPAEKQKRIDFYLQKIDSIPSLPNVVVQLIKLIENPMSSINQIESVLANDQGLTLKVLRLANSAFYAIPGGATTLKRSVTYLGLNTLKQLVISASVFESFKKLDSPDFKLVDFWKHSMATGIVAESIAKTMKTPGSDEAFVCGLVHDMGKLALLMIEKEDFMKTAALAREKGLNFVQAEIEREAPMHAHWGNVLAKKWQLPLLIQSVIKDHHSANPKLRSTTIGDVNQMVDLIYVANLLVHDLEFGNSGYNIKPKIDAETMARIGIKYEATEPWVIQMKEALKHADSMVTELMK